MALSSSDVQFLVSEPGALWAHDYRRTRLEADDLAARLMDETGKVYVVETFDDFEARKTRHYLDGFKLAEISEDFYYQMLNCLPPMYRTEAMGFFMCEFTSGTITSQFVEYRGKFYGAAVDICNRATWITPDKIDTLQAGEPLVWFPEKGN